jgi:hypothetical protein
MPLQIGNFKSTESASKVEPAAGIAATEPAEKNLGEIAAETLTERVIEEDELTPAEAYRKRLERADISLEEASRVFDDMISKGYYEKRVTIKSREAVFRTRTYEDHLRSVAAVETLGPKYAATQQEIQSRHNLAASLVSWNGVTFKTASGDPEKEFAATMTALRRMPAPVYSLLLGELAQFDARMFLIFSEGAVENF